MALSIVDLLASDILSEPEIRQAFDTGIKALERQRLEARVRWAIAGAEGDPGDDELRKQLEQAVAMKAEWETACAEKARAAAKLDFEKK